MLENGILAMVLEYREFRFGRFILRDRVDSFVLGCVDSIPSEEFVDRTIIPLPCGDHLVLIYNKLQEAVQRELNDEARTALNYVAKPHAVIPELDLEIYSRCIVCRRDVTGKLESLHGDDFEICEEYFKKTIGDYA